MLQFCVFLFSSSAFPSSSSFCFLYEFICSPMPVCYVSSFSKQFLVFTQYTLYFFSFCSFPFVFTVHFLFASIDICYSFASYNIRVCVIRLADIFTVSSFRLWKVVLVFHSLCVLLLFFDWIFWSMFGIFLLCTQISNVSLLKDDWITIEIACFSTTVQFRPFVLCESHKNRIYKKIV